MSKITTEDCKNKLIELFEGSESSDWKRTKKYKNELGNWVRDFINKETEKECSLVEINGELERYSINSNFSFAMYKYSPTDDFYNVYFRMEGDDGEDEEVSEEPVRNMVDEIFKNMEITEESSPNYTCVESFGEKVYRTLISNGLKFIPNYIENSFIPDPKNSIKNNVKPIGNYYDLIVILDKEAKNKMNDNIKEQAKAIIKHMSLENLENFSLSSANLENSLKKSGRSGSFVLSEVKNEIVDRIANPDKPRNIIEEDTDASLRKKLGF